jgi:hypothetical protein
MDFEAKAREIVDNVRGGIGGDEFVSSFTWKELHLKFSVALREVAEQERGACAKVCEKERNWRVDLAKDGHQYAGILLGEASGATSCAHAIRARIAGERGKG